MYQPLTCPDMIITKPSRTELILIYIPIIGWFISAILEDIRFRPMVKHIEKQLKSRPNFPESAWGSDAHRINNAKFLCNAAQNCFGWPNDHFLPSDPVRIVCWAHEDALDNTFFVEDLERHMNIKISDNEAELLWTKTLGEALNYLLSKSDS